MSGIVCAIRGGPHCKPTVAQAITLAQNTHLSLHFLYIVNHDFLSPASNGQTCTVSKKMQQMGQTVLSVVDNKASTLGIDSETIVRQGNVGTEILSLCCDLDADYVILGSPVNRRGKNVFTRDSLEKLSQQIEREVGARVISPTHSGL